MKLKMSLFLLILITFQRIAGQGHYYIEKTVFSSNKYDEFCPVIYKDMIVFCADIEDDLFITYENKEKKGLFNIFSVPENEAPGGKKPLIFSRNITTPFNDGPVSFSADGSFLVYSRNVNAEVKMKGVSDMNNTLGLFFAEFMNNEWTNTTGFRYNSPNYSITAPCFSPDGQYLYFSSNMPGGFGGTDIYRSEFYEGNWSEPENLGEVINTTGNEGYPFIADNGDLFFASDGHSGLGNKDIFVTRWKEKEWITPVNLQEPINSVNDDFGLITDSAFTAGYFSSNRDKTDDIYKFSTLLPQLFDCDTLKENTYCFEFWDETYPGSDSLPVIYEWEFSDGIKIRGLKAEHCFPGAGSYWAKLNIIDSLSGIAFLTQSSLEFELTDVEQPYITSGDVSPVNEEMKFSGLSSNLPGFKIEEYIWDFGDGDFTAGPEVNHKFIKPGVYNVKLGVSGYFKTNKTRETKCIIKPVTIVSDNKALSMYLSADSTGIILNDTSGIRHKFSVYDVNPEEEVFRVEVLSSGKKIMLKDTIFDPLREKYEIKEFYVADDSIYSYTVGESNSLPGVYGIYNDVVKKGFTRARVKTYVLAELPTEIVVKINRDFAELAGANFDFDQYIVSETSYPILDKIVKIMEENPELEMEISAHTDDIGSFDYNI